MKIFYFRLLQLKLLHRVFEKYINISKLEVDTQIKYFKKLMLNQRYINNMIMRSKFLFGIRGWTNSLMFG